MDSASSGRLSFASYLIPAVAGVLFSLLVWKIIGLEWRYALAASGAVIIASCAMAAIWFIDDFLVFALVANIPLAMFGKWIFPHALAVPAKGISVGLAELMLVIAYGMWFFNIFVIRKEALPGLTKMDFAVLALLCVQGLSLIGAPNKELAAYDIIYNVKFGLIYFYLSRKIERRHLKGIAVVMLLSIALEGGLSIYERLSGNVAIGVTKGNVTSEQFGTQGKVPGVEDEIRGAGTTIDPHSLGLYLAMTLPLPLVFVMMHCLKPGRKLFCLVIFLIGLGGLVVTFSRSGWLSFTVSSLLAMWYIFFRWLHDRGVLALMVLLMLLIPFYPRLFGIVEKKVFQAPSALIDVRLEMAETALEIWRRNPVLGYGPGNYLEAIDDPDIANYGHYGEMADRPVHNAYLWLAAEIGLLGLSSFVAVVLLAVMKCRDQVDGKDPFVKGLALALLCGFVAYFLDGMTNMMFREAVPYSQLWTAIALSHGLDRFVREGAGPRPASAHLAGKELS